MAWTCSFGRGFLTDDGKFYTALSTDRTVDRYDIRTATGQ